MSTRQWTWKKEVDLPKAVLDAMAGRFAVGFYESALAGQPNDVNVLVALGDLYTQQGLLQKALQIDQRLVEVLPQEPTFHYNLACSHSLLGHVDSAFQALQKAVQLGYDRLDRIGADPDLENLHRDGRWRQLLRTLTEEKLSG